MKRFRVALILPTFNRLGMLKRTLKSLEEQSCKDFIIYIYDDASTDGTGTLQAADFPRLNVEFVRKGKISPPEQFSRMFYSVEEEIVAMVHDDEVYHPEWLSRMMECLADDKVVFAYGQTLVVDAKAEPKRFYHYNDEIKEGLFTGLELREYVLTRRLGLPANGFAIRTSALAGVAPLSSSYIQFDYEWMVRVGDQGKTRILPELLATYTVHRSNTVGSSAYVRRLLDQKSGDVMMGEWLLLLPQLHPRLKAELQAGLDAGHVNLEWLMFLRALGYGDVELGRILGARILARGKVRRTHRLLVRLALLPGLTALAVKFLGALFRHRGRQPMRQRPDITRMSRTEAIREFPTVALFDEPL